MVAEEFVKKIHPPNLKRRVRWYHKKFGIFGYQFLKEKMQVTEDEYQVALKSLKPLKKKKGKNVLRRYGRYYEMEKMLLEYKKTEDPVYFLKAQKLRQNISKPYRLKVRYGKEVVEYSYPAVVDYKRIQELQNLVSSASCHNEFQIIAKEKLKYSC